MGQQYILNQLPNYFSTYSYIRIIQNGTCYTIKTDIPLPPPEKIDLRGGPQGGKPTLLLLAAAMAQKWGERECVCVCERERGRRMYVHSFRTYIYFSISLYQVPHSTWSSLLSSSHTPHQSHSQPLQYIILQISNIIIFVPDIYHMNHASYFLV